MSISSAGTVIKHLMVAGSCLWVSCAFPEVHHCIDENGVDYFSDMGCPTRGYGKSGKIQVPRAGYDRSERNPSESATKPEKTHLSVDDVLVAALDTLPESDADIIASIENQDAGIFKVVLLGLILLALVLTMVRLIWFLLPVTRKKQTERIFPTVSIPERKQATSVYQRNMEQFSPENQDRATSIVVPDDLQEDWDHWDEEESDTRLDKGEELVIQIDNASTRPQDGDKFKKELAKSYVLKGPETIEIFSSSNDFSVGDVLNVLAMPSLDEMLANPDEAEILFDKDDSLDLLCHNQNVEEMTAIFRLINSHKQLDISVLSKEPAPVSQAGQRYRYVLSINRADNLS